MDNVYVIEVHSINWTEVLARLAKGYPVTKENFVINIVSPNYITYYISRDLIPAAALAAALGSTADAVIKAQKIVLASPDVERFWQVPTVDYVGHA